MNPNITLAELAAIAPAADAIPKPCPLARKGYNYVTYKKNTAK